MDAERLFSSGASLTLTCVDYHLEQVTDWPDGNLQLGQVSGLALDSDSNLVIFHRGDHHWDVK